MRSATSYGGDHVTDAAHLVVDHDGDQYVLYDHGKAVTSTTAAKEMLALVGIPNVWTERAHLAYAHELMETPSMDRQAVRMRVLPWVQDRTIVTSVLLDGSPGTRIVSDNEAVEELCDILLKGTTST